MSVLINDMEMPTNCEDCIFCDGDACLMHKPDEFRSWTEEYNNCPLAEIVHCKDCRWGREVCGNIECSVDMNVPVEYHGYDWYCPNGERREDG